MRLFEKDGKINFVDANNVMLGYDMEASCCEFASWFILDQKKNTFETDERCARIDFDLEEYVFDPRFFENVLDKNFDEGGMVIFRITNGTTEKFLHLFNVHNGYYSHGFNFSIDGETYQRDSI
jgi:hypothetical protein